jgi:hypothetical protein
MALALVAVRGPRAPDRIRLRPGRRVSERVMILGMIAEIAAASPPKKPLPVPSSARRAP